MCFWFRFPNYSFTFTVEIYIKHQFTSTIFNYCSFEQTHRCEGKRLFDTWTKLKFPLKIRTHTHKRMHINIYYTLRIIIVIIIIITMETLIHTWKVAKSHHIYVSVGIFGIIHNIWRHLSFVLCTHILYLTVPSICHGKRVPSNMSDCWCFFFSLLTGMLASCLHIPRNDLRTIETRTVIYCSLFFSSSSFLSLFLVVLNFFYWLEYLNE